VLPCDVVHSQRALGGYRHALNRIGLIRMRIPVDDKASMPTQLRSTTPARQPDTDMERTLEALERRPASPRMPSVGLALRVKTSPLVWRLLPKRPLIARALRQAERIWESDPKDREEALSTIEAVVGRTASADSLEELAREYLIERQVDNVLFWRAWKAPSLDPRSAARVREAMHTDRGVVLSVSHTGPFYMIQRALTSVSCSPYVVAGPWFFDPPSHDYWGRRLARWRKGGECPLVNATRSFPVLKALLERGRLVMIYFDMPGSRETSFLGKRATLADGTARLASDTEALVLPLRIRRARETVWLDVDEPLDSRAFAGVEALHVALAKLHERWILENPAAMSDPRSFGWGAGAGPDAWVRPARRIV
jgi:lauroyl/myristoyl acyltransferase